MTDLLEKLWPAFVSEVTEQLDSVELLLAKSGSPQDIDVNHLFRNFHTIKGNCSMIGFTSMETLAHRSEDILASVRSGELIMDDDVVDILLLAISCLQKQFNDANDSRENPPQDTRLVKDLESFVAQKLGAESEAEPEVSAEDRQKNLQALVTTAKMAVPSLVLGLDTNAKPEQIETVVNMMIGKASEAGFKALSRSLSHYLAILHADFKDKSQLIAIAAEIFDDIKFICAENDIDLGLDLGAKLCRSKLAMPFATQVDAMTQLLEELKDMQVSQWQAEQFISLVNLSDSLGHYSTLFLFPELNACWRYIKQLVVELSRGYIAFNHVMIERIIDISGLAKAGELDDGFGETIKQRLTDLQQATAKHNHSSDEVLALKDSIVKASSLLSVDSLVDLKADALTAIFEKIEGGLLGLEVDIDFTDEVVGEKVLTTVRNLGEMVHSRTMFHDIVNGVAQRTSFSVLILTSKPLADIQQILSIIDRNGIAHNILGLDEPETASAVDNTASNADSAAQEPQPDDADEVAETEKLVNATNLSMGSLKVEGSSIDSLIDGVGELITFQNRLNHLVGQDDFAHHLSALKAFNETHKDKAVTEALQYFSGRQSHLLEVSESLQSCVNQVQSGVLDLRVVPIAYVFDRFHKFVRTISQKLDKKVLLDVIGETVKVDKGMIDVLSEPLAHMVRNSIDHGIETKAERKANGKEEFGLIKLKAEQCSGMVIIEITDDGKGLDRDRILQKCIDKGFLKKGADYTDQQIFNYIFEPGFSTSDEVSETSGRGVGMDVVKRTIVDVGGTVSVDSTKGEGTTVCLRLPVSAAIQSVILVDHEQQQLAVPERFVTEVISCSAADVQLIQGQSVMMLRDNIVPLYSLNKLLASENYVLDAAVSQKEFEVLVLANERHTAGLVVDATLGRAEVLVRDAHETLKYMLGVSGAAILGDGSVVIILDCEALFQLALKKAHDLSKTA